MKEISQRWQRGRRACPCFGFFCFLCAFFASIFCANRALADVPATAIKTTPMAAAMLVTRPDFVAAAVSAPEVRRFTLSRDVLDFAAHVEKLARYGVDLNQRKMLRTEKVQLRMKPRGIGGVLQICYRR